MHTDRVKHTVLLSLNLGREFWVSSLWPFCTKPR